MKKIIILISIIIFIYGCCQTKSITSNIKTSKDTVWVTYYKWDTIRVSGNTQIKILRDTIYQIKPFEAVFDTLYDDGKKTVKVSTKYNMLNNKTSVDIKQLIRDSVPIVTNNVEKTNTQTIIKDESWYVKLFRRLTNWLMLLIGVILGFFIQKGISFIKKIGIL